MSKASSSDNVSNIVSVRNLKKYFDIKSTNLFGEKKFIKAVDDVSIDIPHGATFGLVGESGCGKSTLGRSMLRLIEPTDGEIVIQGRRIHELSLDELRKSRRHFQIIFQDPYASLNPRMTVGQMITEPFLIQKTLSKKIASDKARELLEMVGLRPICFDRYAHEFSGGMRQRVSIARALALNPEFLVCDECVSALDVSVQAQILNLMIELQQRLSLTYLFISHDLRVVRSISDYIAVMYLGKIVELGKSPDIFSFPLHPYTQSLLNAIPSSSPNRKNQREILGGDVPSPIDPPSGCRFHPRCKYVKDICKEVEPELISVGDNQKCACHLLADSHDE